MLPKPFKPARRILKPSDLTEADANSLLAAIQVGTPYEWACRAIGLSPKRFEAWLDERATDEDSLAVREAVLRADGQGVAMSHKLLWDGGPTRDVDGRKVVEISKTISENHKWLLGRRLGAREPAPRAGSLPGPRSREMEGDEVAQILAILQASGVEVPEAVLQAVSS